MMKIFSITLLVTLGAISSAEAHERFLHPFRGPRTHVNFGVGIAPHYQRPCPPRRIYRTRTVIYPRYEVYPTYEIRYDDPEWSFYYESDGD